MVKINRVCIAAWAYCIGRMINPVNFRLCGAASGSCINPSPSAALGVRAVPFPPLSSGVITFWAVLLQIFESRREGNYLRVALCSGEGQPLPQWQLALTPAWL